VVVSRADSMLVQKLFEMEVPEIYDGTVVIKAIAREAGDRTKVAVFSKDPDVDCVGACVGMKGMRVQSIIRELRGEKIDIIEYNDDPLVFAANALSPAKINHVSILELEQKHLEVIVDDTQLSLAIGKKGQNVRLAAKLLDWHIDIKSEEEKRQEIESQMAAMALRGASISELQGLGDKTVQRLQEKGINTVEQLAQMTPDELTQIPGIGEKTVEKIRRVVTDYFEQDRAEPAAEAAAAEAAVEGAAEATEGAAEGAVAGTEGAAEVTVGAAEGTAGVPVEEPETEQPVPVQEPDEEEAAAAEASAPPETAEPAAKETEPSEEKTGEEGGKSE